MILERNPNLAHIRMGFCLVEERDKVVLGGLKCENYFVTKEGIEQPAWYKCLEIQQTLGYQNEVENGCGLLSHLLSSYVLIAVT